MKIQKSVVITGASDGIGRAMARAFAKQGFKIGLIARRVELLNQVAHECKTSGAIQVEIAAIDITQSEEFRECLVRLEATLGHTDIFIANAGIGLNGSLKDQSSHFAKTFSVNVLAAVDGIEWMKVKMLERKKGTLIGVSSVAGARGMPVTGAYSASKAAMTSYLESLRIDLHHHNIKVITIAPGFIKTAMTDQNKFTMPFRIPVDKAAAIFARDILRGKELIVAPWQFRPILFFLQICPDFLFKFFMTKIKI